MLDRSLSQCALCRDRRRDPLRSVCSCGPAHGSTVGILPRTGDCRSGVRLSWKRLGRNLANVRFSVLHCVSHSSADLSAKAGHDRTHPAIAEIYLTGFQLTYSTKPIRRRQFGRYGSDRSVPRFRPTNIRRRSNNHLRWYRMLSSNSSNNPACNR